MQNMKEKGSNGLGLTSLIFFIISMVSIVYSVLSSTTNDLPADAVTNEGLLTFIIAFGSTFICIICSIINIVNYYSKENNNKCNKIYLIFNWFIILVIILPLVFLLIYSVIGSFIS